MVVSLAERGIRTGQKEYRPVAMRDLVTDTECLELALKLERRPEADDRASSWPGLNNPAVSTGEFLSLSPADRVAVMIMPSELRRQALTSLYDGGDEKLAQTVRTFSYNLAAELLADGRLAVRDCNRRFVKGWNEDHLTRRQCTLLMVLIGVDSDGEAVMPLNVSNLSGRDFEQEGKLVSKHIAPLMRKIRSNWGQDLLGQIETKWKR